MERRGRRSLRMEDKPGVGNGHDRWAVQPIEINNPPAQRNQPSSTPLSFRGAKPRGNLLGHCANSGCLPGDCHAALRLAMTTGIRGRCLRIRPKFPGKESAFCGTAIAVPYISISKYSVGNGHRAVPPMPTASEKSIPRGEAIFRARCLRIAPDGTPGTAFPTDGE